MLQMDIQKDFLDFLCIFRTQRIDQKDIYVLRTIILQQVLYQQFSVQIVRSMDNTLFTITKDYQGQRILLDILHMPITTCVKWKFTVCLKTLFRNSKHHHSVSTKEKYTRLFCNNDLLTSIFWYT